MKIYLFVHYGFTGDYEVLEVFASFQEAIVKRNEVREIKMREGFPEHEVTKFDVLSFDVCEKGKL